MMPENDTIVAKATATGIGAIGLLRISGPEAIHVADKISRNKISGIASNHARVRGLYDDESLVDEALVTVFRTPHSFTGEDVVELSVHGSGFITSRLLELLVKHGARLAEPGEFTLRAYLHGKMDLAQAEAIADLIASQTEAEHKLAMNQLKGKVSVRIQELRAKILEFAALVELELDFGEEDVEFADRSTLKNMISKLKTEVIALMETFRYGNAIKEGIPIAIAGKPNAGKSTLLNAMLGEDRAIVTDIPGTTRDTIEELCVVDGLKYRFIDTAGIREAENLVEKIGIERTFQSMSKANLVWLVVDLDSTSAAEVNESLETIKKHTEAEVWLVANKMDLQPHVKVENAIPISAKNGHIEALLNALKAYGKSIYAGTGDTTITNARHLGVLQEARDKLVIIEDALEKGLSGDMLAHHMRDAMTTLGRITGEIDSDEVLGEIFGKFCIGK